MVPEGWKLRQIGDFLTESRLPGTNGLAADKITVKLYGRGVYAKDEKRKGSSSTKYYKRRAGQFIYSKLDFLNGAFGIVPEDLDGYESTLDLPTFDIGSGIDAHWLLSYVTRENFYKAHIGRAKGGRKARRVSPGEFLSIEIPLPPLPEQKKIAAILGCVVDAIQATQAVIDQTRKVKQGLLQQLLTRGIGHTRFKETEIGEVPDGWEVKTIGSLCSFANGNGFKALEWSDKGLPIIRIQNLNGSRNFNYYQNEPKSQWIIEPGELLFAWAGVKGVSFGPCIWNGPKGLLNQHIYRIRPNKGVEKRWLFECLQHVTRLIEQRAHGFKSSLLHVRKAEITEQKVAVPPIKEQIQIAQRSVDLFNLEEMQKAELERLNNVNQGLMQDLLTGRVRVGEGEGVKAAV